MNTRVLSKLVVAILVASAVCGGTAVAQTDDGRFYVAGVAQSAFGPITSQSYGIEAGFEVAPGIDVVVEGGRVLDTTTDTLSASAAKIAGFLGSTQTGAGYSVQQPVVFGTAGLRYRFPTSGAVQPYAIGGVGMARVEKDVQFRVNGTEVTDSLAQYGVTLGSDLYGHSTELTFTIGGGALWRPTGPLVIDLQYRYGWVGGEDETLSINRLGVGIGVRF